LKAKQQQQQQQKHLEKIFLREIFTKGYSTQIYNNTVPFLS